MQMSLEIGIHLDGKRRMKVVAVIVLCANVMEERRGN